MKACCEKTLRKAADRVGGMVPHPFSLPSKEVAKKFEPIVRWIFMARDTVLYLIPAEKEKQDKKRRARRLMMKSPAPHDEETPGLNS